LSLKQDGTAIGDFHVTMALFTALAVSFSHPVGRCNRSGVRASKAPPEAFRESA
jgi:hypothetical protein